MAQNTKTGKSVELDHHGKCPECNADWDAGPTPEHEKEYRAPPYRFSRLIGIEIPKLYDGVWKWRCPDCGAEWSRFHK